MFRSYNKTEKCQFKLKFIALEVSLGNQQEETTLLSVEMKRGKQENYEIPRSDRIKYDGGVGNGITME